MKPINTNTGEVNGFSIITVRRLKPTSTRYKAGQRLSLEFFDGTRIYVDSAFRALEVMDTHRWLCIHPRDMVRFRAGVTLDKCNRPGDWWMTAEDL